jgi:hypothetical protein
MKRYVLKALFLVRTCLATILSLVILEKVTYNSLGLIIFLAILGIIGFIIEKKLFNDFSSKFKDFFEAYQLPLWIKKIFDAGIELSFICVLASVGVSCVTDFIELKIRVPKFNMVYIDLALAILVFSVLPGVIWIQYKEFNKDLDTNNDNSGHTPPSLS